MTYQDKQTLKNLWKEIYSSPSMFWLVICSYISSEYMYNKEPEKACKENIRQLKQLLEIIDEFDFMKDEEREKLKSQLTSGLETLKIELEEKPWLNY